MLMVAAQLGTPLVSKPRQSFEKRPKCILFQGHDHLDNNNIIIRHIYQNEECEINR